MLSQPPVYYFLLRKIIHRCQQLFGKEEILQVLQQLRRKIKIQGKRFERDFLILAGTRTTCLCPHPRAEEERCNH